jgi:hypothetical protein
MAIWRRSQSPQVVEIKSPQSGTIRCGNLCMIGTQNKRHHVSRERHFRTEQDRTEQNRTEQNRTEQNRTEQNRTEQNRTEQNRTEQNRTEQAHVITFF